MEATPVILLIAEDEALVALAAQDILEGAGYAVIVAGNGNEAIAMLDERNTELSGLIADVRLGTGPNGWDIARHARELRPDLPVVYTTGDSASEWAAQGVPKSVCLQKPYADAQLITAISTLLNEVGPEMGGSN